ncbi:MAG TPA: diacylglycerol kinase family protein [Pyrinomonadaceae bacterium]|nr:diacylglycerol kinase family protein [Pyrinomonadaceae bacterium]
MKIEAIINAGSGTVCTGDDPLAAHEESLNSLEQRIVDLFQNCDIKVSVANSGAEIIELAKRAARGNAEVIVAGGGDGTINSVAAAVIDTKKKLGILPFGTLNHLAKDLNIPLDLESAVNTIIEGQTIQIDVGEVNGRIFLNNSSLGLYPSIVREREKQQRLGWGKWPAFAWAALTVMRRYPFLNIRLNVEGKEFTTRTPFVFVGNNEYVMETLNIGSRARLDGGKLSLYVTNRIGRLGLIRLAIRALFGGLRQEKDFVALTTGELWIETRHRRVRVARDGEVTLMHPPLHYRVRPGALQVIVPRTNRP